MHFVYLKFTLHIFLAIEAAKPKFFFPLAGLSEAFTS